MTGSLKRNVYNEKIQQYPVPFSTSLFVVQGRHPVWFTSVGGYALAKEYEQAFNKILASDKQA